MSVAEREVISTVIMLHLCGQLQVTHESLFPNPLKYIDVNR